MVDLSKGEKPYLRSLILKTDSLSPQERESFENDYFEGNENDAVTPFTSTEEIEERGEFITYLHKHIRGLGADPLQRGQAILPIQDKDNKDMYHFPPSVRRNLYLLAYSITKDFEKAEIAKIIEEKEKADTAYRGNNATKDRKLNNKGLLVLVAKPVAKKENSISKSPKTKVFHHFIKKTDLKPEKRETLFFTPEAAKMLRESFATAPAAETTYTVPAFARPGSSKAVTTGALGTAVSAVTATHPPVTTSDLAAPSTTVSTPAPSIPEEVLEESSFQQLDQEMANRYQEALGSTLEEIGLQLSEPMLNENGKAVVRALFENAQIQITLLTAQDQQESPGNYRYIFEFINDPLQRKFELSQADFEKYFMKEDGTMRNFAQVEAMILHDQDKVKQGFRPASSKQEKPKAENTDTQNFENAKPVLHPLPELPAEPSIQGQGNVYQLPERIRGNNFEKKSPHLLYKPSPILKDQLAKTPGMNIPNVVAAKKKIADEIAKKSKAKAQTAQRPLQAGLPARNILPGSTTPARPNFLKKPNGKKANHERSQKAKNAQGLAQTLVGGSIAAAATIPILALLGGHVLKSNGFI